MWRWSLDRCNEVPGSTLEAPNCTVTDASVRSTSNECSAKWRSLPVERLQHKNHVVRNQVMWMSKWTWNNRLMMKIQRSTHTHKNVDLYGFIYFVGIIVRFTNCLNTSNQTLWTFIICYRNPYRVTKKGRDSETKSVYLLIDSVDLNKPNEKTISNSRYLMLLQWVTETIRKIRHNHIC